MKNIMSFIRRLFIIRPKQYTYCYCSKCKNELISSGSFISDSYDEHETNHVIYKCTQCGAVSDFNFDIAPFPVLRKFVNA